MTTKNKEKELATCLKKRHYTTYHDAYQAMMGTNLKYKTNCTIYTCPCCSLFSIGHKNKLQKEVSKWYNYIKKQND